MSDPALDDDELLVAYLDGELPREERGDLEQRLINDETLRIRLQTLQRGWDMLELLPSPVATEHGVQSTLELVVADISRASHGTLPGLPETLATLPTVAAQPQRVASFSNRFWPWIAVPCAAILVSFLAARFVQHRSSKNQVNDFPVALYMDAYRLAGNEELINDLIDSPRWRSVVSTSMIPDVDALISSDSPTSLYRIGEPAPSVDQLTSALTQVPDEQRLLALSRWERFDQLDGTTKDELRSTASKVQELPNAVERLQTMRDYARWRERMSDSMVAAIEESAGAQREDAIERAIAETIASIGRATGRNLSEEAIERIDFTLIQIVKNRFRNIDFNDERETRKLIGERMSRFIGQRGNMAGDVNMAYRLIARAIVFQDKSREIAPLDSNEIELIHSMLPSKDAEGLQPYVSEPWMRSMILQDWAQETISRKLRGRTKAPSMAERYEMLPNPERDAVDLMPPETARRWLLESTP